MLGAALGIRDSSCPGTPAAQPKEQTDRPRLRQYNPQKKLYSGQLFQASAKEGRQAKKKK